MAPLLVPTLSGLGCPAVTAGPPSSSLLALYGAGRAVVVDHRFFAARAAEDAQLAGGRVLTRFNMLERSQFQTLRTLARQLEHAEEAGVDDGAGSALHILSRIEVLTGLKCTLRRAWMPRL